MNSSVPDVDQICDFIYIERKKILSNNNSDKKLISQENFRELFFDYLANEEFLKLSFFDEIINKIEGDKDK